MTKLILALGLAAVLAWALGWACVHLIRFWVRWRAARVLARERECCPVRFVEAVVTTGVEKKGPFDPLRQWDTEAIRTTQEFMEEDPWSVSRKRIRPELQAVADRMLHHLAVWFKRVCLTQEENRKKLEKLKSDTARWGTLTVEDVEALYNAAAADERAVSNAKDKFWNAHKATADIGLRVFPHVDAYLLLNAA